MRSAVPTLLGIRKPSYLSEGQNIEGNHAFCDMVRAEPKEAVHDVRQGTLENWTRLTPKAHSISAPDLVLANRENAVGPVSSSLTAALWRSDPPLSTVAHRSPIFPTHPRSAVSARSAYISRFFPLSRGTGFSSSSKPKLAFIGWKCLGSASRR